MLLAAQKFKTYQKLSEAGENELRVAINNFPFEDPIRSLTTRHTNKMVKVTGVVTKRSTVHNQALLSFRHTSRVGVGWQVRRLWVRCAKCNLESGPFEVAEEKDLRCRSRCCAVLCMCGEAFQMLGMRLERALAGGSADDHLPEPSDHHPPGEPQLGGRREDAALPRGPL